MLNSNWVNPVAFSTRCGQARNVSRPDRIDGLHEHYRNGMGRLHQRRHSRSGTGKYDIRFQADQFGCACAIALRMATCPAYIDTHVAAFYPPLSLQTLQERFEAILPFRIIGREIHEHANPPHLTGLLCARRERPCRRRATYKRDEVAPSHGAPPTDRRLYPITLPDAGSCIVRFGNFGSQLFAPGHKPTLQGDRRVSALPPEADIHRRDDHVRFGPFPDSCSAAKRLTR